MAKAKKLPSGSWRCRVYSHTGEDGVKHYESFTAATKQEAEMLAAKFAGRKERRAKGDLTVGEAIEGYINAKEGVLSPSTIRAYRIMLKNSYSGILNWPIRKLTSEKLQIFVSGLSAEVKPKSVRNIYGLLASALKLYDPDASYRVTLPAKVKAKPKSPSDEDIKRLFNEASPELKKCIAVSAFGSLRRGEICALEYADLEGNSLCVTKDIVQDSDGAWVAKEIPKTSDSCRTVRLPDKVVALLGKGKPNEKIIKYKNPGSITRYFIRIRDRLGLSVRFHDLRHYYASIGAALGIPDTYLSDFGGWARGSSVMKSVYQNSIDPLADEYAEKLKKHFDDII